ncbi:Quaternary ammonium compound-resistance protein SugE [Actinomadura rubteroloni]|uniref:Quaternary ammonium compound-resistance protein SugE n=1 Tax=Actinomadura rubteroloni TaxID=1926885 RepID=A0A2P4UHR8_9ACTN|nr:multidrug efflux SMR transporter [Actinomadura rubteroloni]POM24587.1 Quaternary ammonium compound-resistance protein SugE [Actinomadura rubteroloni]
MAWLLLAGAILCEVTATVSLRLSDGFARPLPSVIVVVGYLASFACLSLVLKAGMPVGVVYGIWSACGVALVALIGAVFLGETLTWIQIAGVALVIGGVVALEAGA